jgi:tetratricopeptide (TPR) repeat protein
MTDLNRDGIAHFNAGRFDEALRCFRAAVAAGEGVPEARVFIGHVLVALGRRPEAIAEFVSVISDFPRHLPAYDGLANALLHLCPARDLAAETALRRILTLKAGDEDSRSRLASTLRACGQTLRASGDLESAEKALSKALALGRDRIARRKLLDVMHARGESYLSAGDLKKAEKELRRILDLEPADKKARQGLVSLLRRRGLAHVSSGRLGEAEKSLRRALALAPRDERSRRQKLEVWSMRDRSKKELLKTARLKKSEKVRLLRKRVGAAVTAGRLERAEAALRKALLSGPGDKSVGRQLAEVLLMREQAAESLLQAARAAKGEQVRSLLEQLKAAGQAYRTSGRIRKAKSLLARMVKLDAADARAYLIAGGILFSSGSVAHGRAMIAQALRRDQGELLPGEKFAALMKLGRHKAAIAAAERLLDGRPGLADIRALRDPWDWDDRPLGDRKRELLKLERALGKAGGPWLPYYRADLRGPEELRQFEKLKALPKRRYGWMFAKAGLATLCAGRFPEAESWLRGALAYKTVDWRTRGFLAEALLCLRRPKEAFAEMDRALPEAPADEAGQVVAWRGALDLWLGRYESAVKRFDSALRLGAPYALSWRAAALLKLGRTEEALSQLDEALALYPRDLEAYVWRGEAKRALGQYKAALKDLNEPTLAGADRATPIWLWALFNRALVKAALGDRAGLKADFNAIPAYVRDYLRRKTGHTDMEKILEAGLELSRGYRREEYKQAIWMV